MTSVLARRDRALTPEETEELLRDRLGDQVERSTLEYGIFTLWIAQDGWAQAVERCRDEPLLAYDFFDNLFGVDAREDGFDVIAVLYSTSTGNRIALRTRCAGAREAPTCPSITGVYRGADWMERETWDMFGIEFTGHPGLEPRLLTAENFEGWPLRKDFPLTSRAVKPWPGVKEPAELDDEGNVIERVPQLGDAPGPYELDKALAEQSKLANPRIEPETVDGAAMEAAARTAEMAQDTGHVLAGEQEQDAEVAEAQANDVAAGVAGDQAADAATETRRRADQHRKQQAQARARKAAERAADQTSDADDPGEEGDA